VEAAGRAEKELGAAIEVVKKSSRDYSLKDDPPPCPSVMVDGELIGTGAVPYEVLKAELLAGARPAGGA
jgi:hypothetical protein